MTPAGRRSYHPCAAKAGAVIARFESPRTRRTIGGVHGKVQTVRSHWLLSIAIRLALGSAAFADQATAPHARVEYAGIDAKQAAALAETLAAAWQVYTDEFDFEMPETVVLSVSCAPDQPTRLFNDGNERLFLSIPSASELARPAESGVFNLYGMCHELGHIAMYRILKNRDWMTTAAAEGWAHYSGSVVVDRVFAARGESLWSEPYDFRQDGTARLDQQLAAASPSEVTRAAAQWRKLEAIVGRRGVGRVFAAWQTAAIDPATPSEALLAALAKSHRSKDGALQDWWLSAAPLFVEKRAVSRAQRVQIEASRLSGQPVKLALDDDAGDGKKSIAAGGHARKFAVPGAGDWYLSAVSVYGARYGPAKAPDTKFDVSLCDSGLKSIATWQKPYARFERGELKWVRFDVPPTRVPQTFYVCLNFRPTATNGVYVGFDASTSGNSVVGVPGKPGTPFPDGDWMIRVELDRSKEADPLKQEATSPTK